jgi:DNA-binding NarL/FixJ family response regulator
MSDVRVLLADDEPLFRAGVRLALEGDGFCVCAEADDAPAAVEAAQRELPDLCLVDIDLPRGGGIGAAEGIADALPGTRVVLLTSASDDSRLLDALRAGVWGYLPKRMAVEELHAELRAVVAGDVALPRSLTTRLVEEFRRRDRRRRGILGDRPVRLTPREWEVLDLLGSNLATAEIAARLHVTPATVRTHVAAILHEVQVRDRTALRALFDR